MIQLSPPLNDALNPPPPIQILRPDTGQAERLSELMRELFVAAYSVATSPENLARFLADTYRPEVQAAEIESPDYRTLVAEQASTWLGYGQLRLATTPPLPVPGARPVELGRIYLKPEAQGTGLGRRLFEALLELAREADADGLWLKVWFRADWALRFYDRHGFQRVGPTYFQVGQFRADNWLMYRPL